MTEMYILNPEEEEYTIYSLDDSDGNLPLSLSKGPYYEVLEQIPIQSIIQGMEWQRQRRENEKNRPLESISSPRSSRVFTPPLSPSSPVRSFQSSPVRQESPRASPRRVVSPRADEFRFEYGVTDGFDQPSSIQSAAKQEVFIREWKIQRAVDLSPSRIYRSDDVDSVCAYSISEGTDANYVSNNEIYFCNPGNVLAEYTGLYRIGRPFTRITRRVSIDGGRRENLYSGGQLIGSFEKPGSIKGLPGQFDYLPADIQMKIATFTTADSY